jgi:hypothetical protein
MTKPKAMETERQKRIKVCTINYMLVAEMYWIYGNHLNFMIRELK